ncbi:MAG: PIG-L deacetylase family protein [Candidatus Omnitrophota bacterium]|nr:PIG-L deacetylase family protein [Candidatus Omnitrophota bacterium]
MNILAIGAHFDDVELGCGGTIARHVLKGERVHIYVATHSGYTSQTKLTIRNKRIAYEEGKRAARILGVELICGNIETLRLEFTEELNSELLKLIEEKKIDLIYTHWIGDIHHDHASLAKATLHAGRHVKRLLMYRSNWYHSNIDFRANFYVDITNVWKIKEKAIMAHKSEYNRIGKRWLQFFKNEAENAGQRIGVGLAEAFELVKWIE